MIQMRLTVRRIFQKLSFPISFLEVLALSANSAVYFDFSEDREIERGKGVIRLSLPIIFWEVLSVPANNEQIRFSGDIK